MDQWQPAIPAGGRECGRGEVVDPLVSLAAALAQDADASQHGVVSVEQHVPVRGIEQALEVSLAARATARARGQAPVDALGPAAADDRPTSASQQGADRVPADESRGAEHEHDWAGSVWLRARSSYAVGTHGTLR